MQPHRFGEQDGRLERVVPRAQCVVTNEARPWDTDPNTRTQTDRRITMLRGSFESLATATSRRATHSWAL